ncbi:hypothetical protein [Pararhizobium sp.]|uniref:hypothetical protein n=1 Tax=Pararhizobium sp. TaxID=1977563 RepID=UPI002728E600|nr:hypothetical protein [Pararhizobium sp.]MDO9417055.1 hypothetical protein [Pararhizobium sp.]
MASTGSKTVFGIDHKAHQLVIGRFRMGLPQSRAWRIVIGVALILGGILGFLPVLGFWMVPLGLLLLSHDLAFVRRGRRRLALWWERRKLRKQADAARTKSDNRP